MNLVSSSQTSCLACHKHQDHWQQVEQNHQLWLQQQVVVVVVVVAAVAAAVVVVQEQSTMQMLTSRPGLTIYGGSRSNRVPY
jgi:anti-sigma-K factor RskA